MDRNFRMTVKELIRKLQKMLPQHREVETYSCNCTHPVEGVLKSEDCYGGQARR